MLAWLYATNSIEMNHEYVATSLKIVSFIRRLIESNFIYVEWWKVLLIYL